MPLVGSSTQRDHQMVAKLATGDADIDALDTARQGRVEFVDVPQFAFVVVDGEGGPGGPAFDQAIRTLYSVSYIAHFAVKASEGRAPRVMPLEALWWVEGAEALAVMKDIAAGRSSMDSADLSHWHWRAMILQLAPIDEERVRSAIDQARAKSDQPGLDLAYYLEWTEGPSAQILHVGPYETEQTSVMALHEAIADHGYRPQGRHHEIYLGDPRTSAPERLRTILRQPVELAS